MPFVKVFYSSFDKKLKLWVNNVLTEQYTTARSLTQGWAGQGDLTCGALPIPDTSYCCHPLTGVPCLRLGPRKEAWQPIQLQNARLGAWCDTSDSAEPSRSLHGQMAMFRLWSAEVGGEAAAHSRFPRCWTLPQTPCTPRLTSHFLFVNMSVPLQ